MQIPVYPSGLESDGGEECGSVGNHDTSMSKNVSGLNVLF